MEKIKGFLIKVATITLLCYLVVFVYAQLMANSLMFIPPKSSYQDDQSVIKLMTPVGEKISLKYYPNSHSKYTLIYHNGNMADLGRITPLMQYYQRRGFAILSYDYPGYGTSTGKPTEKSTVRAASTVYRYLVDQQHIPPEKIIHVGYSVGGGVATEMAVRYPSGGLVLLAPFTSAFKIYTYYHIFPYDRFNNDLKMANLKVPLLIVHGTEDRIIPIWHSQQLFDLAQGYKKYLWVEGADHNNLLIVAGETYWQALNGWLSGSH